jgi:hypothetical protein
MKRLAEGIVMKKYFCNTASWGNSPDFFYGRECHQQNFPFVESRYYCRYYVDGDVHAQSKQSYAILFYTTGIMTTNQSLGFL